MTDPSQNQLFTRWDAVPENLRDAVFSEANSDFIWKSCEDEHIPDEKIYDVAKITGYVLMGFLHPEDLAGEIKERLGVDVRTANDVAQAINGRIFGPLRADIDKIYSPLSKLETTPISTGPQILRSTVATPSSSKPTTLSDIGWSRAPASPSPVPTTPKPPTPAAPAMPHPSAPTEPAPVMLHQDTTFKAPEKNAGFTLSRPGVGAEVHLGQGAAVPPPPARPAVLEFGGTPANKPPVPPAPGAIHYTELTSGPRNVSQVAPPTPVPIPAPGVPMTPKPPAPPAPGGVPQPPHPPQGNGAIVKDFL